MTEIIMHFGSAVQWTIAENRGLNSKGQEDLRSISPVLSPVIIILLIKILLIWDFSGFQKIPLDGFPPESFPHQ